jgi:predicted nucleic acid-binding Zn ribbon protein
MREYDPCMGCEYYNKPYWSVVSPCTSCPRVYNTGGYVTTTTTEINIPSLPTKEEYEAKTLNRHNFMQRDWSEPKYLCTECNGGMCRNEKVVLASYPPMYEYKCNKCGHIEYQYR